MSALVYDQSTKQLMFQLDTSTFPEVNDDFIFYRLQVIGGGLSAWLYRTAAINTIFGTGGRRWSWQLANGQNPFRETGNDQSSLVPGVSVAVDYIRA